MSIISDHISGILAVSGVITALPVLQFLAPRPALKLLYQLEIADQGGLFFARHWGMCCLAIGAMLVYASGHPEVRAPIMLGALGEKVALVAMIFLDWNKPHVKGLHLAGVFDTICSLLYGTWLLGLA
jgi:hypothetical protein